MVVTGQKLDSNGNVIDPHETNALYLYDPKTKTFIEKLYEDKEYDIGGYTGGCRDTYNGGICSIDPVTQDYQVLTMLTYEPVRLFFNDDLGRTYKALEQVFPMTIYPYQHLIMTKKEQLYSFQIK